MAVTIVRLADQNSGFLTSSSASTTYVQKNQSIVNIEEIDFTLIAENSGKLYVINPGVLGIGIFIPNNSYVEIPVGAKFDFFQKGAGTIDFLASDSMITTIYGSSFATAGQYSKVTAVKIATEEWCLFGDLV